MLTRERSALLSAVVGELAVVADAALAGECEEPASHKDLLERLRRAVRAS